MEQWKYQHTYLTIKSYLEQMNSHLFPEGQDVFPHLAISKLGRSQLCKYNHTYTNDGQYGEIILNSMYIRENPSNNEIIHYIMLAVDALCQHVVMCKNEGKKLAPHCSQVKTLLKKAGLVYNGKNPLSFTKDKDGSPDSVLYSMLEQDYSDDVDAIAYIEPLPPAPRKSKAQPATNPAQNTQGHPTISPSNTIKYKQITMTDSWQDKYNDLLKKFEKQEKTIQKLMSQIEALKPTTKVIMDMPGQESFLEKKELANATK